MRLAAAGRAARFAGVIRIAFGRPKPSRTFFFPVALGSLRSHRVLECGFPTARGPTRGSGKPFPRQGER